MFYWRTVLLRPRRRFFALGTLSTSSNSAAKSPSESKLPDRNSDIDLQFTQAVRDLRLLTNDPIPATKVGLELQVLATYRLPLVESYSGGRMSADAGACCLTGVSARLTGRLRFANWREQFGGVAGALGGGAALVMLGAFSAFGQEEGAAPGGEANLRLPDLSQVKFLGVDGHTLLLFGIAFCILGLIFGLTIYTRLKNLPVHRAMREISELIYETCKTYLITQGKFLLLLESFIAVVIVLYFGLLLKYEAIRVIIILLFSVVGIAGSYGVAWFGIRVNTFANSRTAFASLTGKAYPCNEIPLKAGMSIGMMLISIELVIMLFILLFIPGDYAGPCFIGFAIGESLGAAALRVAGGIFTKIADIGADLMKIVFKIKEDDARNPGVIADCTGDNAGDSVGPSADGFETYGVTGVALISFIVLAVTNPLVQAQLLVWIFAMRVMMVISSGVSYLLNAAYAKSKYANANEM